MAKIIAVANQKGGVGKTTTCVNLTAALRKRGKRVLLVDLDPQGNATSGMGVSKQKEPRSYDVLIGNASAEEAIVSLPYGDVMPSNADLSGAEIELVDEENREYALKTALKSIQDKYDYILIDCPPSLGLIPINAFVAADSLLVPIQCEYFALEGIADLMKTVQLLQKKLNPVLSIEGIILTMYDRRLNFTTEVENELKNYFGDKVYKNSIPRNVRLAEAPSHGKPVLEYDKISKGSWAYIKVADEFLKRQGKK